MKVAKARRGSTPVIIAAPKPPATGTLRPLTEKNSTFVSSTSNQPITNQLVDDKKKGAADKEVAVDLDGTDKKFRLSTELEVKYELTLITFFRKN
jgi:hypothetical protein